MKIWSKLLAGTLLMGFFAGCSSDHAGGGYDRPVDNGEVAYMSLSVSLPSKKGVRSLTGVDTGVEVGKDVENNVNTLMLVLATTADEYIAHSIVGGLAKPSASNTVAAKAAIERTDIQKMYDQDGHSKGDIRVYVFCNPTQHLVELMASMKSTSDASWVDSVCRVLQGDKWNEGAESNVSIWADNSFLMSNASVAERSIPDTFDEWVETYSSESHPFSLSGDNDGNVDNLTKRGPIDVERSVARFDFRDGSVDKYAGDNTYDIGTTGGENDGSLKVKLVRMGLVNMSKEFYYLRRVSNDGLPAGAGYAVCGAETMTNYVVDTDAEFKNSNSSLSDVTADLKSHFNFPLFNDMGIIDGNTRNHWDNYWIDDVLGLTEDSDQWTPTDKYKDGYHIWRYVTENTIPGDAGNQKSGITTGVVFKGKLLAGDNLPEAHKNLDDAIKGAYVPTDIEGGSYTLTVPTAEGDKNYPILYLFQNRLYVGWNDEVVRAAATAGAGSPLHTAAMSSNDKGNPNELYQALVAAAGTDEETNALTAFRAAAKAAGFTLYQASNDSEMDADKNAGAGYYFYYYAWNRHNDNGYPGSMGTMEFGVVRNNVYKLAVTGISRLGHPRITDNDPDPVDPDNPDEDGDVYLSLSIQVRPWTVRVNDFEF